MASVAELLSQLRLDLDDPQLPGSGNSPDSDSLWLDQELLHYIDQAQRKFAIDTECLPDSSNFTSKVTAGSYWVERDPLIIRIREGYLQTAGRTITPTTKVDIDRGYTIDDYGIGKRTDWRTATGTPEYLITDLDAVQDRLVPIPAAADTIEWTVTRHPLESITATTSSLEVDETWHYELLVWAKVMAFRKQDAETQDLTRAREFETEWRSRVIPEARKYFLLQNRRVGVTSYGGI